MILFQKVFPINRNNKVLSTEACRTRVTNDLAPDSVPKTHSKLRIVLDDADKQNGGCQKHTEVKSR